MPTATTFERYWPYLLAVLLFLAGQTSRPPEPPAPIDGAGLRVLIVEDSTHRETLTAEQRDVLLSTAPDSIRDFCKTHAAQAHGAPEFRLYDQTERGELEAPHWRAALARPRGPLPWILASNGRTGFEETVTSRADLLPKLQRLAAP